MERNDEQIKNVWKPLCIVFAALLALSWVFFGFLYSKGGVDFSTLENPEQNYTVDGFIIGESAGNGVEIKSTKIPAEQYAEYGVSALAESAYTLTATIEPADAVNKTVDWTVAFVNPSSAWASGKTVADYVTVTPESDGALTATVENLGAFGEQIKVTVTSRDNPEAFAECTVDYAKRIESASFSWRQIPGGFGDREFKPDATSVEQLLIFNVEGEENSAYLKIMQDEEITHGVGTVSDSFTRTAILEWSPSLKGSISTAIGYTPDDIHIDIAQGFYPFRSFLGQIFGEDKVSDPATYAKIYTAISNYGHVGVLRLTVTLTGEYSTWEQVYQVGISATGLGKSVSDINLDNSELIY